MKFQGFDWLSGHGIQLFQLTLSDQSLKLKGIFKAAASSST